MSIAVSMGDPAGVGPEIVLKAFRDGTVADGFLVIGDRDVLAACSDALGLAAAIRPVSGPADIRSGFVNVVDVGAIRRADFVPGTVSRACGEAAKSYVEAGVRLALAGSVDALVTLPVNKEAVRLSDPDFSGHTGFIARLCNAEGVAMMLYSPKLAVSHVSAHVSLREAIERVRPERIGEVIDLTAAFLSRLGGRARLAVAGLNPHAGEAGAFGSEEPRAIAPAVEAARARGLDVSGPIPPDTVFFRASRGEFDAVVCMYHDQGHIPMKLIDFEGAVNVTLGLPIVRTSVDHGTAFDIAWKGEASTTSYVAAAALARKLCGRDSTGEKAQGGAE